MGRLPRSSSRTIVDKSFQPLVDGGKVRPPRRRLEVRHRLDLSLALGGATGEADDKAGAYAIQGRAAGFIARLEGSYSGVMGLPLYELRELLQQAGLEYS